MTDPADLAIVERLKRQAERASNIARQMAEAKSLRQDGNEQRRTDLYMWPTPEQTTEGEAAQCIEMLVEALRRLRPFVVMPHPPSPEDRTFALDTIDATLAKVRGR